MMIVVNPSTVQMPDGWSGTITIPAAIGDFIFTVVNGIITDYTFVPYQGEN